MARACDSHNGWQLEPHRYRTGWISDLDLGVRGRNAQAMLAFLRGNETATLFLVGDLICSHDAG